MLSRFAERAVQEIKPSLVALTPPKQGNSAGASRRADLKTLPPASSAPAPTVSRKGRVLEFPQKPIGRGISRHLHELETWIDQPQHHRHLRRDVGRWNQMLSCLQALKQTNLAVTAFQKNGAKLGEGERFLAIYGLLQALVLQQDALCHLAEALKTTPVRLNRHRRLEEIRNIRNWSVGHPTKADRGPALSHHAIARAKLGRGGFSLHSSFDDGRSQYMYVPLPQLARLQRRVISGLLRDMLHELRAEVPIKRAKRRRRKPYRGAINSGPNNKGHLRKVA
jgi:hypothetical protein